CFSRRRRHTRCLSDWSSDVCSSDLIRRTPSWIGFDVAGSSPTTTRRRTPTGVIDSDFAAGNLSIVAVWRAGPVPRVWWRTRAGEVGGASGREGGGGGGVRGSGDV